MDRGGVEAAGELNLIEFRAELQSKRTTPSSARSPIRAHLAPASGNAFSDEILPAARASPPVAKLSHSRSTDEDSAQLLQRPTQSARCKLWIDLLRAQAGGKFPENVTAFRPEMAVHRKYRRAVFPPAARRCSGSSMPTTRPTIARAARPTGRLLSDRSLARLLKSDWPKNDRRAGEERMPTRAPVIATRHDHPAATQEEVTGRARDSGVAFGRSGRRARRHPQRQRDQQQHRSQATDQKVQIDERQSLPTARPGRSPFPCRTAPLAEQLTKDPHSPKRAQTATASQTQCLRGIAQDPVKKQVRRWE